jgi:hypothetical protein
MSVTQIQSLLAPPSKESAEAKTLEYLNSHFNTLDDLVDLDTLVEGETARRDAVAAQVRSVYLRIFEAFPTH